MPNGVLMPNFIVLALSALIPLIVGFIWYNPKVFGDAPDPVAPAGGSPLIFIAAYVLSFFAAFTLQFAVIHQFHFYSILAGEPAINEKGSVANTMYVSFMSAYGDRFRTFKHGAFHGFLIGIGMALPVIGMKALFDRKGFKYIAINAGYWIVCLILMGGIICQFS
jgi:hypothetical protein